LGVDRLKGCTVNSGIHDRTLFTSSPPEIQELVFDALDNSTDVFCLGLTNSNIWPLARKCFYLYLSSFLGPWAGENIVYVGENLEPGDFPPALLEEQQMRLEIVSGLDGDGDEGRLITLNDYTCGGSGQDEPGILVYNMSMYVYRTCLDRDHQEHLRLEAWYPGFNVENSDFYPSYEKWILCNVTTREYVRSHVLAERDRGIFGDYMGGPGFSVVVGSRICWSNISVDNTSIHRGLWAGHRFDITTWTRHERERQARNQEWVDISENIARDMLTLRRKI